MIKKIFRIICALLATAVAVTAFVGCKDDDIYAQIGGRVFDGDGATCCGILIENIHKSEKSYVISDADGTFDLRLEKGNYFLTFVKDSQYIPQTAEVIVERTSSLKLTDVRLNKVFDLESLGYYSADLHQHSVYSDGKNSPSDMYRYNSAIGLGFAALSDHNSVSGNAEFNAAGENSEYPVTIGGIEISSSDKGHINALGTTNTYDSDFKSADDVKAVIAQAKADGAYVQINHPMRSGGKGFAYIESLPEFGFDGYELWNGRNAPSPLSGTNLEAKEIWFEYLDKGFYIPATAGSDNHGYAEQNLGMPRTYVYTSLTSAEGFINAIKSGHSFLSNGPVIAAEIDGVSYGETVASGEKILSLKTFYNAEIGTVNVLVNGKKSLSYESDDMAFTHSENLTLSSGDYVVLEVISPDGGYALTNPIFCK